MYNVAGQRRTSERESACSASAASMYDQAISLYEIGDKIDWLLPQGEKL